MRIADILCFIPISLAASLIGTAGFAQTTYKCGNTYSQVPCSNTAEATRIFKDTGAQKTAISKGQELCRLAIPKAVSLKDPYSAKVEEVGKAQGAIVIIGDQPIEAKKYPVFMNAKNSYGAYTGAKLYLCFVTVDESRLLKVESLE